MDEIKDFFLLKVVEDILNKNQILLLKMKNKIAQIFALKPKLIKNWKNKVWKV